MRFSCSVLVACVALGLSSCAKEDQQSLSGETVSSSSSPSQPRQDLAGNKVETPKAENNKGVGSTITSTNLPIPVAPLHPPLVKGTYFLHLDQCISAGQPEANCMKGYSTAYSMHEKFRPSYRSRELCQNVFERCTTFDPATPIMEGFGMLPAERDGEWFFMPLYKAKGGKWVEIQEEGDSFKLVPLP